MEVEEALLLTLLVKRKHNKNKKHKMLRWMHPVVGDNWRNSYL
jgi:hypothetical protein